MQIGTFKDRVAIGAQYLDDHLLNPLYKANIVMNGFQGKALLCYHLDESGAFTAYFVMNGYVERRSTESMTISVIGDPTPVRDESGKTLLLGAIVKNDAPLYTPEQKVIKNILGE